MTDASDSEETADLRAQAAAWVVRTQSSDSREEDWLALEAWLGASPAHLAAFEAAERLWHEFGDSGPAALLAGKSEAAPVVVVLASRRAARPGRVRLVAQAAAVAAGVLVVLVLGGAVIWKWSTPPAQEFATAVGQSRSIVLADGSRITLNSGSRLTAWIGHGERRVALDAGEAAFEVAHDRDHPFVVAVADQRVTVVGTHFDILKAAGQVTVTVASGVVEVGAAVPGSGAGNYRLTPGYQLEHQVGSAASSLSQVTADDAFSWTKGYLVYRDRPLGEVVADLNRYFRVPIRVDGSAARLSFSGVLMLDEEEAVVARLRQFLPITVVHASEGIVLQPR